MLLVQRIADDDYAWHDGQTGGRGFWAEWPAQAGQRVIGVMSGEQVVLTQATAPRRNRTAWRHALPYALEDQFATDVERLHFALGPTATDGSTPVAVVDIEALREWLHPLQAAGLNVHEVIPATLLLPWSATTWSLLITPEQVLVRTGAYSGFTSEPQSLPWLLNLALAQADPPPSQLLCWGQPLTGLDDGVPVVTMPTPSEPLAVLHQGSQATPAINLLQGAFGPRANVQRWLRPWRTAAVLSGVLVSALVVQAALDYWQLQRQRNHLQTLIEQTFRQALPDVQRMVNPRVQLANRLQAVTGSGAESGEFLSLLAYSGDVLREFPDVSLQAVRFRDGRLEFDLEGGSLEQLERLQQRLRSDATHEAQLQASVREDRVVSRLTVTAAGAS